mmetsp:Transcript_45625/g.80529  ORF Transcript_45625/g.80529 Transcript_45625/m.80529 type:complete len:109 (-) Transcript_45625:173-499(-)
MPDSPCKRIEQLSVDGWRERLPRESAGTPLAHSRCVLFDSQAVAQNPTEIQTGSLPEVYNESPFTWYNFEEPRVFENSNINRSSECLAPQPIDVFARPILEPPPNEFP